MPDSLAIQPAAGPLNAVVRPPGSKSITNRALVCAALAEGKSFLNGALASDDTRVMIDALNALGIEVTEHDGGKRLEVTGAAGKIPLLEAELFVGNSGTTVRFLSAMLTLGSGAFRLDGSPRMRERPIADLVDALRELGANLRCESDTGCPPLWVHANGLPGGRATVRGAVSSQFLSALMMAAPCAASPIELAVEGELVSKPYVRMTLEVMQAFGAEGQISEDWRTLSFPAPATYAARTYEIEPDASAASYFWAAAAIVGGKVTVEGLSKSSLQGDVAFVDRLEQMGCRVEWNEDSVTVEGGKLSGIKTDMNAISDTVQTLAAVALFAEGPTEIHNVAHVRHKETDRIGDLARELRRVGAVVEEMDDGLRIVPAPLHAGRIETYDDHRMAMSLALVGLKQPGIEILDPQCTAKTYPEYFRDLESVTGGNRSAE